MNTLLPLLIPVIFIVLVVKFIEFFKAPTKKARKPKTPSHLQELRNWEAPKSEPEENIYKSKRSILSPTEQTFFKALQKAAYPDYGISLKVRVADILQPEGKGRQYYYDFNRIKAKHIDFLLYDSKTFQIAVAVELDDQSHQQQKRQERDEFLNEAFEQANVPLCRFQARTFYDPQQIAEKLSEKLNPKVPQHPDAQYMPPGNQK